jgi:imidazolonepropionase
VIYDTAELLADVRELVKATWDEAVPAKYAQADQAAP